MFLYNMLISVLHEELGIKAPIYQLSVITCQRQKNEHWFIKKQNPVHILINKTLKISIFTKYSLGARHF